MCRKSGATAIKYFSSDDSLRRERRGACGERSAAGERPGAGGGGGVAGRGACGVPSRGGQAGGTRRFSCDGRLVERMAESRPRWESLLASTRLR